jgi:capsular polysaccharide biosynthesis protein
MAPAPGSAVSEPASRRKFLIELRRRGWVVVLSVLVVVAAAWAVGKATTPSSSAEAVLVVHAAVPLAEQPNASTQLAATYAVLIPLDSQIQEHVERALPNLEDESYTVANDPNTAVLRLNFSARTGGQAIAGARVLAHAISGGSPVSGNIDPKTVAVASLPTSASGSGTSSTYLAVAAILGVVLGLVLLGFWRPRDVRIDTLRELRRQLECPCLEVDLNTTTGLRPLFDALADISNRRTVAVPAGEKYTSGAESLARVLNSAFGEGRVKVTAVPGSDEAGEVTAAAADTTIFVVSPGVRAVEVAAALDVLGRYDASPAYAILVVDGTADTPPEALADRGGDFASQAAG